MRVLFSIVFVLFWSTHCFGFIPPLPEIFTQMTKGRKSHSALRLRLRHKVTVKNGISVNVDETIIKANGRMYFKFSVGGKNRVLTKAELRRNSYYVNAKSSFPIRSAIFLKNFFSSRADEIRKGLLTERFIRSEQLQTFVPGFKLEGDPKTWNLKENRIKHSDIYYDRTPFGVAIKVVGLKQPNTQKAVYFRNGTMDLQRLEWKEEGQLVAWNFRKIESQRIGGRYPKVMSFEIRGVESVRTDMIEVKTLGRKDSSRAVQNWKKQPAVNISNDVEAVLRLLLSYR